MFFCLANHRRAERERLWLFELFASLQLYIVRQHQLGFEQVAATVRHHQLDSSFEIIANNGLQR